MKEKVKKIITKLEKLYTPQTALVYKKPFELLAAVILSAQCTDKRVNIVTKELFKKYKTVMDYASADIREFEKDIHSTGFYKNKAKSVIGAAKAILKEHNGKLPLHMEKLVTLPGVGRKTANVVLGAHGIAQGVVVDTHVKRLAYRMGLTKNTNPEKIEKDLMKIVLEKDWIRFSHFLILHGRAVCAARKPQCAQCVIDKLCPKKGVDLK